MPHEIHTSESRSYRGCRRRWDYAYRQGFVPEIQPKPLEFGIAFHMGFEGFYTPELWSSTTPEEKAAHAVDIFTKECVRQRDSYMHTMNLPKLPDEVVDDYNERLDIGTGMFAYYATHVHPEYDSWFKPVKVEIPFVVPILIPETQTPLRCQNSPQCGQSHSNDAHDDDSRVVYAGTVDMLVEDTRFGGYYIWDHKTAAALAADDGFLELDDQIAGYCWALLAMLGIDIKGFIYQEIRKDYPRPPKMLKRHSGGRMFSVDKNQPTIPELYIPYVQRNDTEAYEAGHYDEFIEYLQGPDVKRFHQRFVIRKSLRELTEIGKNVYLQAREMINPDLAIYPSVGRFVCGNCAYRQPCIGQFRGEDVEYLLDTTYNQTNRRYWMDQPRSSDKSAK